MFRYIVENLNNFSHQLGNGIIHNFHFCPRHCVPLLTQVCLLIPELYLSSPLLTYVIVPREGTEKKEADL